MRRKLEACLGTRRKLEACLYETHSLYSFQKKTWTHVLESIKVAIRGKYTKPQGDLRLLPNDRDTSVP